MTSDDHQHVRYNHQN